MVYLVLVEKHKTKMEPLFEQIAEQIWKSSS